MRRTSGLVHLYVVCVLIEVAAVLAVPSLPAVHGVLGRVPARVAGRWGAWWLGYGQKRRWCDSSVWATLCLRSMVSATTWRYCGVGGGGGGVGLAMFGCRGSCRGMEGRACYPPAKSYPPTCPATATDNARVVVLAGAGADGGRELALAPPTPAGRHLAWRARRSARSPPLIMEGCRLGGPGDSGHSEVHALRASLERRGPGGAGHRGQFSGLEGSQGVRPFVQEKNLKTEAMGA